MVSGRLAVILSVLLMSMSGVEASDDRYIRLVDQGGNPLYVDGASSVCLEQSSDLNLRIYDANSAPDLYWHVSDVMIDGKSGREFIIDSDSSGVPVQNNNDYSFTVPAFSHAEALNYANGGSGLFKVKYRWWNGDIDTVERTFHVNGESCVTVTGKVILDANANGVFNSSKANEEHGINDFPVRLYRYQKNIPEGGKSPNQSDCGYFQTHYSEMAFDTATVGESSDPVLVPLVAGSARTDENGNFSIAGLSEEGFYVLEATDPSNPPALLNTNPSNGLLPVCGVGSNAYFQFLLAGYTVVDVHLQTPFNTPVNGNIASVNNLGGANAIYTQVSDGSPAHGTVSGWNNGSFVYTPDPAYEQTLANQNGGLAPAFDDQFDYQACVSVPNSQNPSQSTPLCYKATVFITVSAQQQVQASSTTPVSPQGSPDLMNATDGVVTSTNCRLYTSVVSNSGPNYVSVDTNTGAVTVAPNAPVGSYEIVVIVYIDISTPGQCRVYIPPVSTANKTVLDPNNPAVTKSLVVNVVGSVTAVNDTVTTTLDTSSGGYVGKNDIYPQGISPQYSMISRPSNGTVVFNSDGSFVYTPNNGYVGSDSFNYKLCLPAPNSSMCSSAAVNVTINRADQATLAIVFKGNKVCCNRPVPFTVNGGTTKNKPVVQVSSAGGASCKIHLNRPTKKTAGVVTGILQGKANVAKKRKGQAQTVVGSQSCSVTATMSGDAQYNNVTTTSSLPALP